MADEAIALCVYVRNILPMSSLNTMFRQAGVTLYLGTV
jgi:hypothetical protein